MNNKYGLGSIEVAGLSLGFKVVKDYSILLLGYESSKLIGTSSVLRMHDMGTLPL